MGALHPNLAATLSLAIVAIMIAVGLAGVWAYDRWGSKW